MILVDSSVWVDYFNGQANRETGFLAENYLTLRKKGITICKTANTIIATFCIEYGFPLLYSDRDFDPFVRHLGLKSAIRSA